MTSQLLILSFAAKNLRLHWIRSLLAVIGIVIGVLAIGYMGTIQQVQLLQSIEEWKAYDSIQISPNYDYFSKRGMEPYFSEKMITQINQAIPDQLVASSYSPYSDLVIKTRTEFLHPFMLGISGQDLLKIAELESGTIARTGSECVAGGVFASDHQLKVGSVLTLTKRVKSAESNGVEDSETNYPLRVVGITRINNRWDTRTDYSLIPYEPWLRTVCDYKGYDTVTVKFPDIRDMGPTVERVKKIINARDNVTDFNDFNQYREMYLRDMEQAAATTTAIAGISLIVAGVSIFNVMVMSVRERYREIGVLRSIGTRRFSILSMFIYEALMLGIIGSSIGGLIALIGAYMQISMTGQLRFFYLPETLIHIPYAMSFGICICLISGLYPAWKASRLNPIEALRYE